MTVDQAAALHLISDRVLRRLAALAIIVAAIVHIPVTPEHFEHAPYIGVLFVAFTIACIVLAAGLLFTANFAVAVAAAVVCAEAIVAYVLTRVVALPMLTHDVGNWLEPLGVAAIISEAIVVATCVVLVSRGQVRQRQDRGAAPMPTAIYANHD
ncbi:MAG: hypothetical protein M3381_15155 [Actinomycetota bacterium]|nr:hypothetical protein [Actinomycetota bacterium]